MTTTEEKSLRQCWRTPQDLWGKICSIWHPGVDMAASSSNHLCPVWFGPDHHRPDLRDGLSVPMAALFKSINLMSGVAYCNPGFSGLGSWCEFARQQTNAGYPMIIVMAMVAPSTEWWTQYALTADEIIYLTPRVNFVPPEGIEPSRNNHDNCLLIYRHGPVLQHAAPRCATWNWKRS